MQLTAQLKPGMIIDARYQIERQIAAGGFALIYTATRLDDDERVVIKALHQVAREHDSMAFERFEREAMVMTYLSHPSNVHLLDFGLLPDQHLYLVLEYLDGQPLDRYLSERGAMTPEQVSRYLPQLLGALAEAHGQEIIHRDIKPANVFVCGAARPDPPQLKLLDYGFAKLLGGLPDDEESTPLQRLTQNGMLVGTPGYMAPDMMLTGELTAASDLYSLGLVVYEMLVGEPAFQGKPLERAQRALNEDPPPLPRPLRRHPLAALIRRMTARDLDERFASAQEVLDALEAIAAGDGARKPWWKLW